MAENHSFWSEALHLENEAQINWVKNALTFDSSEYESDEDAAIALNEETGIKSIAEDISSWPEFEFNIDEKSKVVYLYSEGDGNISNLVKFVQGFLSSFRPNGFFHLEWADTCSKPRAGEFGGGAVFITANKTKYMLTSEWIRNQISEFEGA